MEHYEEKYWARRAGDYNKTEWVKNGEFICNENCPSEASKLMKDLAWFAAEILLQELEPQKAIEIAGPHAFWPMLNKQQLYDSVYLDIAAGSTGMPDSDAEKMRWIELMPIIMQNIQFVQQIREMGVPDQYNPYVQLLEEMQKVMMQNQVMQQAMGQSAGSAGSANQPPQAAPPQQMNEVANAPENRVNQRLRNNQRAPQGEM